VAATKSERLALLVLVGVFFVLLLSGSVKKNVIKDWPTAAPQFPVVRAVGGVQSKTGAATPSLPDGTEDGDLLLMFFSSRNEATPTATDWTAHPTCPQSEIGITCPSPSDCTAGYVLYNVWDTGDNRQTSDVGAVNRAVIIGIQKDTYDPTTPFNACNTNTQTATLNVQISGATTTTDDTRVFGFTTTPYPDKNLANEYSSWGASGLSSIVEHVDVAKNTGDGGGMGVASGTIATAASTGTFIVTSPQVASRANILISVNSKP
jgi:hypothetical protein